MRLYSKGFESAESLSVSLCGFECASVYLARERDVSFIRLLRWRVPKNLLVHLESFFFAFGQHIIYACHFTPADANKNCAFSLDISSVVVFSSHFQ